MAVDPKRAEDGLSELIAAYREAQRILAAQATEALKDGRLQYRRNRVAALRQVVELLDELGVRTSPTARMLIENAWTEGDDSVLRALAPDGDTYNFNRINREALHEAQEALVQALDTQRTTVAQQVSNMYRRAGQRSVSLSLLGARGSTNAAAKDLQERLAKKQITAFIDRSGRVWDMERYTDMVARTATRQAVVDAQVQRMTSQGIEFARVSRSSNPCPICSQWQGVLVSLGGKGARLGTEPATTLDALPNGGPPFHPSCRHYLTPEATDFADFRRSSGSSGSGGGGGGPKPPTGGGTEPPNPFGEHLAQIHRQSRIPAQTRRMARKYTDGNVARELNGALRAGQRLTGDLRDVADALDDAFDHVKQTAIDGTVWRALRNTALEYPAVGDYLPAQPAYTSTTLSKQYALERLADAEDGDLWEIVVRVPSQVLDVNLLIGSQQSHEDEILLPRDADFKVIGIRPRGDGKRGNIVTVEVWAKHRTTD